MRVPALLFCALSIASAQTRDERLTFEVASVKPSTAGTEGSKMTGGPGTADPGRIVCANRPLRALIIEAFTIRNFQVEHPQWMADARYDIVAKVPSGATSKDAKIMMQNLLKERFHLEIRREERTLSVFELMPAKSGLKLKPSAPPPADSEATPPPPGISTNFADGKMIAKGRRQTIAKLLTWLTGVVEKPVLDQTGFKGEFDFTLTWTPEFEAGGHLGPGDLFGAVQQQLGIRMESRKIPVNMLIVLNALKVPVEN